MRSGALAGEIAAVRTFAEKIAVSGWGLGAGGVVAALAFGGTDGPDAAEPLGISVQPIGVEEEATPQDGLSRTLNVPTNAHLT